MRSGKTDAKHTNSTHETEHKCILYLISCLRLEQELDFSRSGSNPDSSSASVCVTLCGNTRITRPHTQKNVSSPELQERLRRPANHSLARVCRALSQTRPPSLMIIDERGGAWRSWMRELLTSQITKAFVPSLYKRLGQQWPN